MIKVGLNRIHIKDNSVKKIGLEASGWKGKTKNYMEQVIEEITRENLERSKELDKKQDPIENVSEYQWAPHTDIKEVELN